MARLRRKKRRTQWQFRTTLVGALQPEHLHENLAIASRGPLPADVYQEAKRRLDAAGERPEE